MREFHRFFPDKEILADLKIMDGGYLEASYAYEAGAAYATILGVSDNLTIEGALKAARDYDLCGRSSGQNHEDGRNRS